VKDALPEKTPWSARKYLKDLCPGCGTGWHWLISNGTEDLSFRYLARKRFTRKLPNCWDEKRLNSAESYIKKRVCWRAESELGSGRYLKATPVSDTR